MTVVRSREFADLDRALEQVLRGRGCVALIEGAAGMGKSTIVGELVHRAARRGLTVARGLQELPAADEPTALIIDDAHLADPALLGALEDLSRQTATRQLMLALAFSLHRLGPSGRRLTRALRAQPHTTQIRLLALDERAADQLIRDTLPDASAEFCEQCRSLAGGSPFLLSELVTWIAASGLAPVNGAPHRALEPVPPRTIREFVRAQLESLGPDPVAIAAAVAISRRELTLDEALTLAGLEREQGLNALDHLIEAGVMRPGELLAFAAKVTARCLQAETPKPLAADLHRRAAELAAERQLPRELGAHHLMLAPPNRDPRVVGRLIELADSEVADGNPREAKRLIHRALAEDAAGDGHEPELLARLGHVDLLHGRSASVSALAAAAAGHRSPRDRAEVLVKLGLAHIATGALREALFAFDAAKAAAYADADDALARRAAVAAAIVGILVPERHEQSAATIAGLGDSPGLERNASAPALLIARAGLRLLGGSPHESIRDEVGRAIALQDGDEPPPVGGYFQTAVATLLALIDDFRGAERACDAGVAKARDSGSMLAERNVELARALALLHRGDLDQAGAVAGGLLGRADETVGIGLAGPEAVLANVRHEQDEAEQAEEVALRALHTGATAGPQQPSLLEALARIQLERGRLAAALQAATDAGYACQALGITNPAVVAWQPISAVCYAEAGDKLRARALAREAFEAADEFGAPRGLALTLRARAHVEAPDVGLRHLKRAREVIEQSGAELEHAHVLLDTGKALHAAGNDRAARATLNTGIELADRIGARRLCRIGIATLRDAGGRPRRTRMTGPEALTPSERRVAELARAGLSNPAIARKLVITRKTVEWHLSKAYAKLQVRSRDELHRALGERSAADDR